MRMKLHLFGGLSVRLKQQQFPRPILLLFVLIGLLNLQTQRPVAHAIPDGLTAADWNAITAIVPGNYLKASNTEGADSFSTALAISGDTIVIGADFEASNATGINGDQNDNSAANSGAVYVFVRSGSTWSQQAYIKASNTEANDGFGSAVAIDGDTIVVGAFHEASNATGVDGDQTNNSAPNAGAAYVFKRTNTTWSQQAYLKASNTEVGDGFGWSVAISGDTIVVAADSEDSGATGVNGNQSDNSVGNSGAAYVFTRSGSNWSQQAYLKASNPDIADGFGLATAVSGDTILIGTANEDSNATGINGNENDNSASQAGAVYVFFRTGTTWSQQAYLKASNTDANDKFGDALAIDGETAVVGARGESSNATGINGDEANNDFSGAGATYVFIRNGNIWSQQAYLKASNTNSSDSFGGAVAILGDTLVVGASSEDSNATGVNGDQTNNSLGSAGAAYLFVRGGTLWGQDAYLKASNTDASDAFGRRNAVGLSANHVVIGAVNEASNATGVDGNQSDNSMPSAGAVYTFNTGLPVVRWNNPAGGSWATAANWLPATVPDSTTETVFDLDNSYDVTVGARQSGRSRVEAGSVLFQSANLTLTGPFSVGGAASFSLPTGSITASDLIVGHLPPTNPASPPTAHVTISNDGTVFTAGAQTIVGQAGEGDLFVNDGRLNSGEALIGQSSAGTATVGGTNALWEMTSLNVGAGFTATLNIESGSRVLVNNAAVIGQANSLQTYPARITVDNAGVPLAFVANFGVNDLTIGDALPGTLDIRNGGVVAVLGLLQVGVQAHNLRLPDAVIVVNGTDGVGNQASNLFTSNDALLGMGDGSQAEWLLTNGGHSSVSGNLHLGHTAGSSADLLVSGFSTDGLRSTMEAGTTSEVCRVGFDGEGSVQVNDGGLLTCQNMNIGGNVGSTGEVRVSGQRGAVASTLQVENLLCVGGAPLCGSNTGVAGTLTLQNNSLVKTDTLAVTSDGHLLGQGTVQVNTAIIAGEVSPGLGLPVLAMARVPYVIQPSTLVISGSVVLSETAVISLDIHALTNYDQLVINGPAQLAGQLVLNFGEGFAPHTGDVFNFIQTDSATGNFTEVAVAGLAQGFMYDLAVTNGVIALTALNDGLPTTEPSPKLVFLPWVIHP